MNTNPLQGLIDGWSRDWQSERAMSQMTLGGLIAALASLPSDKQVVGFGEPISYRGYYCDLAFEPVKASQSVESLLTVARGCMGRVFQGYKGGFYRMGETTPIWLSKYGMSSSPRIMGLNTDSEIVTPVLAVEDES